MTSQLAAGQPEIDEAQALHHKTPFLSKLLSERLRPTDPFDMHLLASALRRARRYNAAMTACSGSLLGVEFKHGQREAYACVLPEPNCTDFRVLFFDAGGFHGHHCERTQADAEIYMLDQGYEKPCQGQLDRLSLTTEWQWGTDFTELLHSFNSGTIGESEFNRRASALKAKRNTPCPTQLASA